MPADQLIKRIRQAQSLTASERRLADFIGRNAERAVFENVTSLAEKTGVSKATVVRFIAKLGYSGFSDLRRELQEDARVMFESAPRRYRLKKQELETSGGDILERNVANIIQNLRHVLDTIDRSTFQQVAEMILDRNGSLYLCGFRTSHALAQMFHFMIERIRPRAFLIGPQFAMMPDMLVDIAATDILLAVFRYPYALQTVRIARHFSNAGARILLITDSAFSPLADLATHQIVVGTEGLVMFRSFTAVAAVLETLHLAALRLCDPGLNERLESAEALFKEFDIYWPRGKGKAPRKPVRPGR